MSFDDGHRASLCRWLASEADLDAGWLFGSRARGDARPESDFDVAVLTRSRAEPVGLRRRLMWTDAIAQALGVPIEKIDLLLLRDAPALLAHAALREGILLLDRDPDARVELQIRALHRSVEAARLRDEAMRARAARLGVALP